MSETKTGDPAPAPAPKQKPPNKWRTYCYFNGKKLIHADPMALHRRLQQAIGTRDLGALFRDALPDPESDKKPLPAVSQAAWQDLADMGAQALKLHPLEEDTGEGCNEDEAVAALADFCRWLSAEKKDSATSPSGPPPTTAAQEGGDSPAAPSSDSGSTVTA